jgi:hypothetical protein
VIDFFSFPGIKEINKSSIATMLKNGQMPETKNKDFIIDNLL